jgi:hypothetical protein
MRVKKTEIDELKEGRIKIREEEECKEVRMGFNGEGFCCVP